MGLKPRKSSSKNPPIFSHEFFIQNHADIVSCVAMVFIIGLMIQVTSPFAYMFIAVHHNVTQETPTPPGQIPVVHYTYGLKDFCAVFFYFLICIVMHAIIQEYVLDKISRKLHLSKVKHREFNESGQLIIFYLLSVLWGGDVIFREEYFMNVSLLWDGYPHNTMVFMFKFFYIIQLSYWLHCFPELYLQKTKREDMPARIRLATISLVYILAAYLLNFSRVGICLLVLHYSSEGMSHAAKLLHFIDKSENENTVGFMIANVMFVIMRLGSIILSVLTFWYGLALSDTQGLDIATGNFNIPLIRIAALVAVCTLQAWLMWNFITQQLKKLREQAAQQAPARKPKQEKRSASKKKKEEHKRKEEDDELPEVDQNTKKSLRSRASAVKSK